MSYEMEYIEIDRGPFAVPGAPSSPLDYMVPDWAEIETLDKSEFDYSGHCYVIKTRDYEVTLYSGSPFYTVMLESKFALKQEKTGKWIDRRDCQDWECDEIVFEAAIEIIADQYESGRRYRLPGIINRVKRVDYDSAQVSKEYYDPETESIELLRDPMKLIVPVYIHLYKPKGHNADLHAITPMRISMDVRSLMPIDEQVGPRGNYHSNLDRLPGYISELLTASVRADLKTTLDWEQEKKILQYNNQMYYMPSFRSLSLTQETNKPYDTNDIMSLECKPLRRTDIPKRLTM